MLSDQLHMSNEVNLSASDIKVILPKERKAIKAQIA